MTTLSTRPVEPARQPGDLTPRELLRWSWRQLTSTSMRTALVLLLLLALAAIPGSVVPQEDVDSVAVSRWQEAHPRLTPAYEWLGLFSVYDSVWFSAIYILLVVSLVGCIVPRCAVYLRGAAAGRPPQPGPSRRPSHLDHRRARARGAAAGGRRTAWAAVPGLRRVRLARRGTGLPARGRQSVSIWRYWWCWWGSRSEACSATAAG